MASKLPAQTAADAKGRSPATSASSSKIIAQVQIRKYFLQVSKGCGDPTCENEHCSSSPSFNHPLNVRTDPNKAALLALSLFQAHAKLCSKLVANGESSDSSKGDTQVLDSPSSSSTIVKATENKVILKSGSTEGSSEPMDCGSPAVGMGTASSSKPEASEKNSDTEIVTAEPVSRSVVMEESGVVGGASTLSIEGMPFVAPLTTTDSTRKLLTDSLKVELISDDESADDDYGDWEKDDASSKKSAAETLLGLRQNESKLAPAGLTLDQVTDVVEKCRQSHDLSDLLRLIERTFLSPVVLRRAFHTQGPLHRSRTIGTNSSEISVNLVDVRSAYRLILSVQEEGVSRIEAAFVKAFTKLATDMQHELQYNRGYERDPANYLNALLVAFEMPLLQSPEFLTGPLACLCKVVGLLSAIAQARLARIWASMGASRLTALRETLQQLVTVSVISGDWGVDNRLQNESEAVNDAVKVMKVVYYASLYGGERESSEKLRAERQYQTALEEKWKEQSVGVGRRERDSEFAKKDPLAKVMDIHAINCIKPLIPTETFINDCLNEAINIEQDYVTFRGGDVSQFSFTTHWFALSTTTKSLLLYFDNQLHMMNERRMAIINTFIQGVPSLPYLRLNLRRTHIVTDALISLEMIYQENPADLRKQLFIDFEGEPGVDEGGISKEFFQLIVEELFNPDIGMFVLDESTHQFWFNPCSFEADKQFTLVGILLGLAIYNHIILDVNFPPVCYRKLLGKLGRFEDLEFSEPELYRSLSDMLEYEGDMEDLMVTFSVSQTNMFGELVTHELVPGGAEKPITHENKRDFVDKYADFLLNSQIEEQFSAFSRGFHLVIDGSPLESLFLPSEVEMLVCGSRDWNFVALESTTKYDSGYSEDSSIIKYFWEIVHAMDEDPKRKLLQFTTGSDRVPVGGLAKIKLVIARNGPDTDRLPTAHTCFNVLLLPEYSGKDKLKDRLLKAISYSKGFGMI